MKKMLVAILALFILLPSLKVAAFSDTSVFIDVDYVIVKPTEDGKVTITNMTSIQNSKAEEYKGDGKSGGVFFFPVPEGATDLEIQSESMNYELKNGGILTKDPLAASGTTVIPYAYNLPISDEGIKLTYTLPVQSLVVMIPEGKGSITVQGGEITAEEVQPFDEASFTNYTIEGIKTNEPVTLKYDPNTQPTNTSTDTSAAAKDNEKATGTVTKKAPAFHNPGHVRLWEESFLKSFNPHVLMIVLLAILLAGIGYWLYFKRKANEQDEVILSDKEEQEFQQLLSKRTAILSKISELEIAFESGEVTDDEYQKKLEAYKQLLVQVKLSLIKFTA